MSIQNHSSETCIRITDPYIVDLPHPSLEASSTEDFQETELSMAQLNRVVVVIGASRGIGRSLVSEFAKYDGVRVVGTVRKVSDGNFGVEHATGAIVDLNQPDTVVKAVNEIGPVDVLMINAGMGLAEPVLELDEKGFQNYLDVNVIGPWRVVKSFLPSLRQGTAKKIVFMSSMSGSMQLNYEGKASVRGAYAITKVSSPCQSINNVCIRVPSC